MSVQAMSWVIQHSKAKGNAFVVLLMVANHAKSDGTGAWPSIHTLAREARISDRTVQRALVSLVKIGEIRIRKEKGPHHTNLYDIRGVNLTPGGDKLSREGCQSVAKGVSQVSPNPSLTIHKDKEGRPYTISVDGIRVYL